VHSAWRAPISFCERSVCRRDIGSGEPRSMIGRSRDPARRRLDLLRVSSALPREIWSRPSFSPRSACALERADSGHAWEGRWGRSFGPHPQLRVWWSTERALGLLGYGLSVQEDVLNELRRGTAEDFVVDHLRFASLLVGLGGGTRGAWGGATDVNAEDPPTYLRLTG